jgi:hypothetical protein
MDITHLGSGLSIACGIIALVLTAQRKSRFFAAAMGCLALAQLPLLLAYDPGGWIALTFALLSGVFSVLHIRILSRDPEWRASWRK